MRQHEAVVQVGAPATGSPRWGSRQNQAIIARTSNCCARLMRACGGISKARNSSRPSRPVDAVGRVELVDAEFGAMGVAGDVDQQVAEQPVDEPQRRVGAGRRHLREGDFKLVQLIVARLVERGAWLVGPMNRPEKR